MWSQNKRQKIWESLLDGLINFTTQIAWINSFFFKKKLLQKLCLFIKIIYFRRIQIKENIKSILSVFKKIIFKNSKSY